MNKKIMIAPSRYVQGPGVIRQIGEMAKNLTLGEHVLVICGRSAMAITKDDVETSLREQGLTSTIEKFNGECCMDEINRINALGEQVGANLIIGIGGGKVIDTAKAVAHNLRLALMIVPTVASTDAPCSAVSLIYTPDGFHEGILVFPQNPNLVLVDTEIIVKAPTRLLVSGMGDALATRFEAEACFKAGKDNILGGKSTEAAQALAKLCYTLLIEHGKRAKAAVERQEITEDVEKIVEANTLLSGLGFESGGLAAAHAIETGFTVLQETHHCYHGEKVAFGTLVQMVMEKRTTAELNEVLEFCCAVGLPVKLSQLGVMEITPEKLRKVAESACAEGIIFNMPVEVNIEGVYNAILEADALGSEFLAGGVNITRRK